MEGLGVWVCGCWGVWVFGWLGVWVFGCLGGWVCGCLGVWVFGCLGGWVCGCLGVGVWVFGVKEDRVVVAGVVRLLAQRRGRLDLRATLSINLGVRVVL